MPMGMRRTPNEKGLNQLGNYPEQSPLASDCPTALLVLLATAARAGLIRLGLLRFWLTRRLGWAVANGRSYATNSNGRVAMSMFFRHQDEEPQRLLVVLGDALAKLVTVRKVGNGIGISKGRALSEQLDGPLVVPWEVLGVVVERPKLANGACVTLTSKLLVPVRRSLITLFASFAWEVVST